MISRIALKSRSWHKLIAIVLASSILVEIIYPALAQTEISQQSPVEQQTDLYVIYSHPGEEIIAIELRDQRRLPNGDVEASISIRGDSLIAYELIFEATCPTDLTADSECPSNSAQIWTNAEFLPLYPGRVYDFGTIRIPRNSSFVVKAAKFGLEEDTLAEMTLIQLSLLAIHLVGVTPPIGWHEFPQAAIDSFKIVKGPIGAIASASSAIYELLFEREDLVGAFGDVLDAISEVRAVQEVIAEIINLIVKEGPHVTGDMVGTALEAVNLLQLGANVKRSLDAFNQMRTYPELVTAVVTPAPIITDWPERYRIFQINEQFETQITLRNMSSELWAPDQGYALLMMVNQIPVQAIPLKNFVRSGERATWDIPQRTPPVPGIYRISFQMALHGTPIGPRVPAEVVAIPENSGNLQALLEAMVEDARERAGERFDEFVAELERRIAEALVAEIQRRLLEICGGTGGLALIGIGFSGWHIWRRKREYDR